MALPGIVSNVPASIEDHPRKTVRVVGSRIFTKIDQLTQQANRETGGSAVAILITLAAAGVPTTEALILAAAKNFDTAISTEHLIDEFLIGYQGIGDT